jgi:hypothetical protein
LQSDSSVFYIEKIGANSKYDSRYIFNRAFQIIPQDKPVRESEIKTSIQCLVSDLKASGIFEDVKVELRETGKANARTLLVDVVYHSELERFVISDVVLTDFSEVDKGKFFAALAGKGLKSGVPFLRYYYGELERKIGEALVEAYPMSQYKGDKTYWLTIVADGMKKVKLVISPSYLGCK